MRIRAGIITSLLLAAGLLLGADASAQPATGGYAGYPVSQAGGPAVGQQLVPGGPGGQFVDAYGNPAILPASYQHGGYCGPGCYGGYGGQGQVPDLFGGAASNVEQIGPHYFDLSGEFIFWRRDSLGSNVVPFTAEGSSLNPSLINFVQTTDSLSPDFEPGFRLFARYDIGALSLLEVGYTGLLNQSQSSAALDTALTPGVPNDLFSPFTNFGLSFLDDAQTIANPFAGGLVAADLDVFDDTDRAIFHGLSFQSSLQSAEINYRRYWVGYSPRLSGTLLAGFRYTRLDERFAFTSIGNNFAPGATIAGPAPVGTTTAVFSVDADNDLTGFQIGGDAAFAIRQGIRLQTEGKVGIYNNDISVTTLFNTTDGTPAGFAESFAEQQVAFSSDLKLSLVIDVLPSLTIKAGYEVLFLNSIATAVDNINLSGIPSNAPGQAARVAALDDQSDAVFHGAHWGLEYVW